MLVWLTRFILTNGQIVDLPRFDPVDGLDTEGYRSETVPLSAGGTYDPNAGGRLPRRQRTITRSGTLIESTAAAIQNAYNAIASCSGADGLLYGQTETWIGSDPTPTSELAVSIPARMLIRAGSRAPRQLYRYQGKWAIDMEMAFEVGAPVWRGTRHGTQLFPLDTGSGLDLEIPLDDVADSYPLTTSPITLSIPNDGNASVRDAVLTLTAQGSDITAFSYIAGTAACAWAGTLKAGNSLVIDTGNCSVAHQTVTTAPAIAGATSLSVANAAGTGWTAGNRVRVVLDTGTVYEGTIASITGTTTVTLTSGLPGGVASGRAIGAAAYSGFTRDPVLHTQESWLRLIPGTTAMEVRRTGGSSSSTLGLFYYDGWR